VRKISSMNVRRSRPHHMKKILHRLAALRVRKPGIDQKRANQ